MISASVAVSHTQGVADGNTRGKQFGLFLQSRIPGLRAVVRDPYSHEGLKGNMLQEGMDPSPGNSRRDSGLQIMAFCPYRAG